MMMRVLTTSLLLLTLLAPTASAETHARMHEQAGTDAESASALAQRLERQLFRSSGLQMRFDLAGEGKITIRADLKGKRVRIETPKLLVISDGHTIWNITKRPKQVTIDNVSGSSPFRDPSSLFRFAEDYAATSVVSVGAIYQVSLALRPKESIRGLMKAAGDIREIRLDLTHQGSELFIRRAAVIGAGGAANGTDLHLTSLRAVRDEDFRFTPTKAMKVVDLRE